MRAVGYDRGGLGLSGFSQAEAERPKWTGWTAMDGAMDAAMDEHGRTQGLGWGWMELARSKVGDPNERLKSLLRGVLWVAGVGAAEEDVELFDEGELFLPGLLGAGLEGHEVEGAVGFVGAVAVDVGDGGGDDAGVQVEALEAEGFEVVVGDPLGEFAGGNGSLEFGDRTAESEG